MKTSAFTTRKYASLHLLAGIGAAFLGVCSFSSSARATLIVTSQIGGIPTLSGATLVNFNAGLPSYVTLSANNAFLNSGAPPYYSGATAAFFGETPNNGPDATRYLALNGGGSATFNFATPQNYFGLLWGSVDSYNSLTFYDAANNNLGTVTGSNFAESVSMGNQGLNGTTYVNVTSPTAFTKVVASSGAVAFEFDDVAFGRTGNLALAPEPGSIWALLALSIPMAFSTLRQRFVFKSSRAVTAPQTA
ncbi:MAG: hypothetical protein NTZ46_06545 [Verrucomicrobia bacterium]|nr:hypothetical protein [Verrucomicrobiota bacterium]